jgi:hypothetical protein
MASDEQWEIWYKENCKYDFEQKIYKEWEREIYPEDLNFVKHLESLK